MSAERDDLPTERSERGESVYNWVERHAPIAVNGMTRIIDELYLPPFEDDDKNAMKSTSSSSSFSSAFFSSSSFSSSPLDSAKVKRVRRVRRPSNRINVRKMIFNGTYDAFIERACIEYPILREHVKPNMSEADCEALQMLISMIQHTKPTSFTSITI